MVSWGTIVCINTLSLGGTLIHGRIVGPLQVVPNAKITTHRFCWMHGAFPGQQSSVGAFLLFANPPALVRPSSNSVSRGVQVSGSREGAISVWAADRGTVVQALDVTRVRGVRGRGAAPACLRFASADVCQMPDTSCKW